MKRPDRPDGTALERRAFTLEYTTMAWMVVEAAVAITAGLAASALGIAITIAALIIMPALAAAKLKTGRALANDVLIADASESILCAALSGAALLGLVLNSALGWWWADPVAALAIAALALREGWEAWKGD